MNTKLTLLAVAAAFAFTGMSLSATDAEAKRGGSRYKAWEFDTGSRPARGYEGFSGNGGDYCSYRREPERKCWYNSRGGETCKIVNWRLIQKCY